MNQTELIKEITSHYEDELSGFNLVGDLEKFSNSIAQILKQSAEEEATKYHKALNVLDHGLVRMVDHMGNDLSIVRNARVSYDAAWRAGIDGKSDKNLRGNWLKGMKLTESADSLLRHLTALLAGEDVDPESKLLHVDHIVCCAKILSHSFHTRKDLDDRG